MMPPAEELTGSATPRSSLCRFWPIAKDPGKMGSLAIHRGLRNPRLCTCPGIPGSILQDRIGSFARSRVAVLRGSESPKPLAGDQLSMEDRCHHTAADIPAPWTARRLNGRPPRPGNLDLGLARLPHFRQPIVGSAHRTAAYFSPAASRFRNEWAKLTSAGLLKSENLLPYSLRQLNEGKLTFGEQVVVAALVNDPYETVLRSSGVRHDSIELAEDQRRFVSGVLKTQREVLRQALHGLSR